MPFLSSFSNTGRAKATFPGQAGTPSISSQASGQVAIAWTAPAFSGGAPITDYKIEYSTNGGSSWTEWSHTPSTSTSATVTGLSDYFTYEFRVTAKNAVGLGTASVKSAGAAQFNAATGGTETTVSNYNGTGQTWKVHSFTSNGTFTMSRKITNSSVLVISGGGGGGAAASGLQGGMGGGAGGMLENTAASLSVQSYSVTIGGGGGGSVNGANSSFGSFLSTTGGGHGANRDEGPGAGGSGGAPNGAGIAGQGYAGANGMGSGGGAGGVGLTGCNGRGPGRASVITGSSVTYAYGGAYGDCGAAQLTAYGSGGNGNPHYTNAAGNSGIAGVVVVAYRIA